MSLQDSPSPEWIREAANFVGGQRHIEKSRSPLLYAQGGEPRHIILIVRGFVARTYDCHPAIYDEPSILDIHGPQEFVGQTAVFDSSMHYPDSARIISESADVIFFDTAQFSQISMTIRRLLQTQIAQGIKRLQDRIAWLKFARFEQKAALHILELSDRFGRQRKDGITEIELPLSQTEFASFIGASREHVSRTLSKLRDNNLVIFGKGKIVIPDVGKFRSAVLRK